MKVYYVEIKENGSWRQVSVPFVNRELAQESLQKLILKYSAARIASKVI